jgi:D-xylose transport system substrate-binding protein
MYKHRLWSLMAALLILAFIVSACAPAQPQTEPSQVTEATEAPVVAPVSSGDTYKVGVLWDFLQVERRVKARDYLQAEADRLGFEIVFQNANGDEKLQLQQAENLITQGVDLIVILPQNADAACPVIEQAHQANIKVVAFDRLISNCDLDYYIGFNNDVIGDMMAEYVFAVKPDGNWAMVNGAPTDPNVKQYRDGWLRVIQPALDSGAINMVSDTYTENWDPANAMKAAENFLTANNDDIDVVLAMNDGTGGGVVQALKARNLNGKVLVTGQDGELAAIQRIAEGDQAMTVWKPDDKMATVLAESILKILKGEELPDVSTTNNNFKDVTSVLLVPVAVDKDNICETVIASDYLKLEDIYQNLPKDQWPTCGAASVSTDTTDTGETYKVGVLWDFLQVERRVKARDYLQAEADRLGFEIVFQNANGDEKLQLQQAENLITQGVDLIVILPQNADAACPVIEQAHQANIKVVAFDRLISNCDLDYYIGFNNDVIGDMMAEYVFAVKPDGNWAMVNGAPTDPNVKQYRDGWLRVIQPALDSGAINMVSDTYTENWDPANAMKAAENFLTANNDDIDVVLAMNDGTGGGVVQALKARNLNGKVLVTGQDGELAAIQRIAEGDQAMTVWKPDDKMATVLAESILKILKGQDLPDITMTDNKFKDVPSVLLVPVAVDKDNICETVIASDYLKLEDIYQNLPKDQWPDCK